MSTHKIALAFSINSATEGAECINLIRCRMNAQIVQHNVLNFTRASRFIRKAYAFTNQVHILIKHSLEATIFAVQQYILPMGIIVRFLCMVLIGRQFHNSRRFSSVKVINEYFSQRSGIGYITAISTVNTYSGRSQHHICQGRKQIIRHFAKFEILTQTNKILESIHMRKERLVASITTDGVFYITVCIIHRFLKRRKPRGDICTTVHKHRCKIVPLSVFRASSGFLEPLQFINLITKLRFNLSLYICQCKLRVHCCHGAIQSSKSSRRIKQRKQTHTLRLSTGQSKL